MAHLYIYIYIYIYMCVFDISSLRVNGPSEPGRLRDVCVCQWVNRTTLQIYVTYLTGALYVHPLWFYKHQHDNRVRSTQNAFSLPFATILVNCAPNGEIHNYCTPHIIKKQNFLIHRCNYILLSHVYCIWQVVKSPTIIFNKPVFLTARLVTFLRP